MKISSSRSRRSSGNSGADKTNRKRTGYQGTVFVDNLRTAQIEQAQLSLVELIPHLDQAAVSLIESRTLRNFNRYRELVREFLDRVMRENNMVQEISGFSGGRHKIMIVVQKVDKALEQLGREVLDAHSEGIQLLRIVDEIRGLLLDIYT